MSDVCYEMLDTPSAGAKANQNVSFHHDQFAIKRSYFFDSNR